MPRASSELGNLVGRAGKTFFFFGLTHLQVSSNPGRGRIGGPPGAGAERARGIWQEKPRVQRTWWEPRVPLSSPGAGPCTRAPSLRASPSALRASAHVCAPVCVRLFTCLPCNPLVASLQPRRRGTLTPKCRSEAGRSPGRSESPLPFFPSSAELREPRREPRPGGQMEPARTPADKLVSPSIALFRSGQVSLRPSRRRFGARGAPWAPRRGQGSPGSAQRLPRGLPLICVRAGGALWTLGRSFAERGMGG